MNSFSLSVFFPAHNEEENITETLRDAIKILDSTARIAGWEIIVVNDGSTDGTKAAVREVMAQEPRVKIVNHDANMGYGMALQSGIKAATLDYVFFTDADLQFYIEEIAKLIEFIPEYDVVIGYRNPRRDPFMRLVNGAGWNFLNRAIFGLKVKDIDCAFKIFRREALQSITITSHGAMISAEILIKLKQKGYTIREVPVSHRRRVHGVMTGAKPSVIVKAFRELLGFWKRGELKLPEEKK